jgi:D-threonine aldolase
MDHGNPAIDGATVWFCSDEHVTFAPDARPRPASGDRVGSCPPTSTPRWRCTRHWWVVQGDEVVDRWPIDLRGW